MDGSVAVDVVTRMEALFPFTEADVLSNRSRKSFVFWQCEVGGAAVWWLAREFHLPVGDWPRRSNGAESMQCRVPLNYHLLLPPTPTPRTLHPLRSALPLCWLSHIVYYGLKCDSQHTLSSGVLLWQLGNLFWRARCVLVIWGLAVETTYLPWQWISLRFYACWSSHLLRWKVNNNFGIILAGDMEIVLSETLCV